MRRLSFGQDESGGVAMLLGLSVLPFFLLVGVAVDFGRVIEFRSFSRSLADSAALAVAGADVPDPGLASLEAIRQRITAQYGGNAQNVSVTGDWMNASTYRVTVSADVKAFLIPAAPGGARAINTGTEVQVVRIPPKYQTEPPTLSQLSPEAADYNRISMYCYDPTRKVESDKGRRLMTAIADNGTPGLDYSRNAPPACKEGEVVSYKLRNVRNMRASPSKWDASNQEVYEYYTDTTLNTGTRVMTNTMTGGRAYDNGRVDAIDMQNNPILETILCDTALQCRAKSDGGILPNNHETDRSPGTATGGCAEGKYMYFGWEDRPPTGGSDKDYDDIRLIVSCPKMVKIADKQLHIVK